MASLHGTRRFNVCHPGSHDGREHVQVSLPPGADLLAGVKADPDLSQIISSEAHFIATIGATGLAPDRVFQFQRLVLSYYAHFGRDLPWRETNNPYHILVSEIMLQQTQVARVLPKYHEFLEAFPDVQTLAAAPLGDVLAVWQGMGYNRRAIALQRTARILVEQYNGELPRDRAILVQLPGIGRATASAIVVYAFNTPAIYIETNVRRVIIHFFFQDRSGVKDSEIEPIVQKTLYVENPRLWFNALMDYGTWLKTREDNPNLRSSAYKKQSPFEGSDRQIRGNILKIVLEEGAIAEGALIETIAGEKERIQKLLVEMEKEGFIHRTGGIVSIAKTGAL